MANPPTRTEVLMQMSVQDRMDALHDESVIGTFYAEDCPGGYERVDPFDGPPKSKDVPPGVRCFVKPGGNVPPGLIQVQNSTDEQLERIREQVEQAAATDRFGPIDADKGPGLWGRIRQRLGLE